MGNLPLSVQKKVDDFSQSSRIHQCLIFSSGSCTIKQQAARDLLLRLCGEADDVGLNFRFFDASNKTDFDISKIEGIRELISQIRKQYHENWLIVYIENAHLLSTAASNCLLKLIEEPMDKTLFIFSVANANRMLPTIRSRSLIWNFPVIKQDLNVCLLHGISPEQYLQTIMDLSPTELILLLENAEIDREQARFYLNAVMESIVNQFKNTQDKLILKLANLIRKYYIRLERPVNVLSTLLCLSLGLKEIVRHGN